MRVEIAQAAIARAVTNSSAKARLSMKNRFHGAVFEEDTVR